MEITEAWAVRLETKFDRMMELMQAEFLRSRAEMSGFRVEVNERFERVDERFDRMDERFLSVLDRLDLLEKRVGTLEQRIDANAATLEGMRVELSGLAATVHTREGRRELDVLRADTYKLQMSINTLSDDMRQRFRVMSERLAAVEKRLAI